MTPQLRRQVLQAVSDDGRNVAARLAQRHKVSRQAASVWLARLKDEKLIASSGVGRGVVYALVPVAQHSRRHLRKGLHEDRVWTQMFAPTLTQAGTGPR